MLFIYIFHLENEKIIYKNKKYISISYYSGTVVVRVVHTMLDQFYTNDNISKECLEILFDTINKNDYEHMVEPSAGTGSFYKKLPQDKRIGIDISPKCEGVKELDFLTYDYSVLKGKVLIVGNPPFGRVSSLAVKFFNKSAEFADCIAFIVPRTFKRVSIQNKLDLNFELIYNKDLPLTPCCFTPKMSAKCCFQIWKKTNIPRKRILYEKEHSDFIFLKLGKKKSGKPAVPKGADFAIKAYGSNCGEIKTTGLNELSPKSWHWIKIPEEGKYKNDILIERFNQLDYSMSQDTVRQDSLGKQELIYLYTLKYPNI